MAKKKKQIKKYLFEQVLAFLQHNSEKTFNYKQIGAAMELNTDGERLELIEVLEALKQQGFVKETEVGKFQSKSTKQFVSGTIDFTQQGTAFVIIGDGQDDVFIPFKKTKDALNGDLVKITVDSRRSGRRKEGEVTEVIKRAKTDFVGTVKIMPKFAFVIPDNGKIHVDFFVRKEDIMDAEDGQKVLVRFKEWRAGDQNPTGEIVSVFGNPGEHKTEMHAIMAEYGLPEEFPAEKVSLSTIVDIIVGSIVKRLVNGRSYGVAVLAEGLADVLDHDSIPELQQAERDPHGNIRFAEVDFGALVKRAVRARLSELNVNDLLVVDKNVGYELRCHNPNSFDREYTRLLGYGAVDFLLSGGSEAMITRQEDMLIPIPFSEFIDPQTGRAQVRLVDVNTVQYSVARKYQIRLTEKNLNDGAFLARFSQLTKKEERVLMEQFAPVAKHWGAHKR